MPGFGFRPIHELLDKGSLDAWAILLPHLFMPWGQPVVVIHMAERNNGSIRIEQ